MNLAELGVSEEGVLDRVHRGLLFVCQGGRKWTNMIFGRYQALNRPD